MIMCMMLIVAPSSSAAPVTSPPSLRMEPGLPLSSINSAINSPANNALLHRHSPRAISVIHRGAQRHNLEQAPAAD
jgi:hypothetical protein